MFISACSSDASLDVSLVVAHRSYTYMSLQYGIVVALLCLGCCCPWNRYRPWSSTAPQPRNGPVYDHCPDRYPRCCESILSADELFRVGVGGVVRRGNKGSGGAMLIAQW